MSTYRPNNPLIVQSDHSILLETANPHYGAVRDRLLRFAELVKSPEHVHTYRITSLSIWNARAAGLETGEIVSTLEDFSKYPLPHNVVTEIHDVAGRWGRIQLLREGDVLVLRTIDKDLADELATHRFVAPFLKQRLSPTTFRINVAQRGWLKQTLTKIGFPVEDVAGYEAGQRLALSLRERTLQDHPFELRSYQKDAIRAFHLGGSDRGGSGVITLPCGAGKTIVGMGCMAELQTSTLILATSISAVRQWRDELLDKTTLTEDQIGEYSGLDKKVRPVTIATYQMLTHRHSKDAPFTHLEIFDRAPWGLIIYDEVHLLPAPVFRATAGLQARRRLGLTATLVREDGREADVFALVGPKRADAPWKELESEGWIAEALCTEVRLPLPQELRLAYATAPARKQFRVAASNPDKAVVVRSLLERHAGQPTLIMGMYVDQIRQLAQALGVPVLTGTTAQSTRDRLYSQFRAGELPVLAVSKVGNFSIDLPAAEVAIQISGTFGSRQEEAQRLGRIVRPKPGSNRAYFYSLVSRDTIEQEFAMRRQLFLCEQGYHYKIIDAAEL